MDLWVLPLPAQSQWFSRVDWYLNWQMCKGLAHEKSKPSVELFRVMEEGGVQFQPTPTDPKWPLMVISNGRIPAGKCVVIEKSKTLKDWLEQVASVAQNLHAQTLRVFLPSDSSPAEARKILKDLKNSQINIEFTSDEDAK